MIETGRPSSSLRCGEEPRVSVFWSKRSLPAIGNEPVPVKRKYFVSLFFDFSYNFDLLRENRVFAWDSLAHIKRRL